MLAGLALQTMPCIFGGGGKNVEKTDSDSESSSHRHSLDILLLGTNYYITLHVEGKWGIKKNMKWKWQKKKKVTEIVPSILKFGVFEKR